ncbi:hypothetical protein [Phycicoccus sp.]|uniref:hypothetical protein n=1 Tax=Phycicoccus sp. TaxID=1902410 RepID=UPI00338E3020
MSLAPYLTRLNEIRAAHPALRWLRNVRFHRADDEQILVFSKTRLVEGKRDTILVVANMDAHSNRESIVRLDLTALGLPADSGMPVHDLISDAWFDWGADNFVRLGPDTEPVHVFEVRSY